MKFTVGYQWQADRRFMEQIVHYRERVREVYFSFGNMPSGRSDPLRQEGLLPYEAQNKQLSDLAYLSQNGIALHLCLNGNCYGRDSQSRLFFDRLGDTVEHLHTRFGLNGVTTASPLIAKFIKQNFEDLAVRASVNMRIGTVEGMEYLRSYFDGYYMQREYNRDFARIRLLKEWCDGHQKQLYMLANSGCLNFCSAQTFHDNLVAHEGEIAGMDNAYVFHGMCAEYLGDPAHYAALYEHTNFVRPEDIAQYEGLFVSAKLATRIHPHPELVLKSYAEGKYSGDLLRLLEPSHSIYPYVLENGTPPRIRKLDTDLPMYEYPAVSHPTAEGRKDTTC